MTQAARNLAIEPMPTGKARGYLARVALDVLTRSGARLGLAWIVTLLLLAVFAPLLANSAPLLMKADGQVSSPALRLATWADAFLLIVFVAGVVLLCLRRVRPRYRWWMFCAVAAVTLPVCYATIEPPRTVVYSQWREMTEAGRMEWAVYTPIPYSPTDRQSHLYRKAPSAAHWMGTEDNGQDVASRLIHASRIAMAIGFIATGIALVIGVTLGGLMGYYSGVVDIIGMRIVEIVESIPTLFLLLICVAFFGRDLYLMMVIIGLVGWPGYCRFVRAEFLKLRAQDYVQAARACGLPLWSILFKHMLPNGAAPVLVSASFGIASAILAEAVLSFLGLGLIEEPSWGQMLNQSLSTGGTFEWWIAVYPGGAIFLTVFAYNLVGEALRDAIDPHSKKVSQA